MKFEISLEKENLLNIMRRVGYAPEPPAPTGEEVYYRSLGGRYPRFHIYARMLPEEKMAIANLHLDQRQPSYQGSAVHGGEYEGQAVELEAARVKSMIK